MKKLKISILGSGNIGTDLLMKCKRSDFLECSLLIGRSMASKGLRKAESIGVKVSDRSIEVLLENPGCCELVFDATSALDHKRHWEILKKIDKKVIDLTPSQIGKMIVPAINLDECVINDNVNMISCGGQASIPIAYAIASIIRNVEYIEVVSSIASPSAGPATRLNIDEYVENTEEGIRHFTKCTNVKAILILNPANPCIDMQTTISVKTNNPKLDIISRNVFSMVNKIKKYVPGYNMVVQPVYENGRIVVMVRIKGCGDFLPSYAGNLDIINCSAIATAERYAKSLTD